MRCVCSTHATLASGFSLNSPAAAAAAAVAAATGAATTTTTTTTTMALLKKALKVLVGAAAECLSQSHFFFLPFSLSLSLSLSLSNSLWTLLRVDAGKRLN